MNNGVSQRKVSSEKICHHAVILYARYFTWDCVPDVGQCSGNFGGYSFGCINDTLPEPPEECEYTNNELGTCDCNGQG